MSSIIKKFITEVSPKELEKRLYQLKFNAEWYGQNIEDQCQRAIGMSYGEITTFQQYLKVWNLQDTEKPVYTGQKSTACFQCGADAPKGECIPCHEGMSHAEYNRARRNSF